jgi:UDP-N-acetylmuramate--alanine ligase
MKKNKKIHFIGIGGIGVSALAGFYLAKGYKISGSDLGSSEIVEDLRKQGAEIFLGHSASNLKDDVDLVIYTAAVTANNSELKKAKRLRIKTQLYAKALGDLTKKMHTIAVSGMHGKSTTTAMIALMLEKAGLDPTVIVGTKLREWGNKNYRVGKGKYLVIEADEYNASFLNYWPKIIVLTNIEEEHLDFYQGGLKEIMKTFRKYVKHMGRSGVLIANAEDKNVMKIVKNVKCRVQKYSGKNKPVGLSLMVSGKHNISNAMAAIVVAKVLKISEEDTVKSLNNFSGSWRRMELRGEVNGAKIYDDYGHHPTEIKATLQGARELLQKSKIQHPKSKIYCVFQPHQYQRTYKLFGQFVGAFGSADKTIILPIFSVPGREKDSIKKKVSSKKLVEAINKPEVIFLDSFDKAKDYLEKNLKKGDVCVIMGAGDVYKLTEIFINS